MALMRHVLLVASLLALNVYALPAVGGTLQSKRQTSSGPIVDLGYEVYQGTSNSTTGLNSFLG